MIIKLIECDECSEAGPSLGVSDGSLNRMARAEGWLVRGGGHWCPICRVAVEAAAKAGPG